MTLFAQNHHNCPTCRCTDPLEAPVQVDAAHIRAEALREAAETVFTLVLGHKKSTLEDAHHAILALIPTPDPSPDVPTPPDGWNVMKLGQVGWHVVQSANGWETSRIFGAECLLRSGGGDEFGPALDATPDGGRVAADAPTPSPDVGALLMVENIDTISDLCRKHKVKEPSFRAILRALAAQEGGE